MKDIIVIYCINEGANILNDLLVSAKAVPLPVHRGIFKLIGMAAMFMKDQYKF